MNWKNLKLNACPKCTGVLIESEDGYECSHNFGAKPCDFFISTGKFNEIIRSLYLPRKMHVPDEEENLAGLNNL